MTTAYTSLLGLALPVTGELSGTWGDTVNNSITSLLDSAVAGTTTITTDTTLSTTTGAANQARQAILLCSPASANITVTAPAQSKIYTVINTSGTYTVTVRGAGPTTGVTLGVSEKAVVAWNGSDFIKISNTSGAGTFTDLTVTGNTILGDASTDTATINAAATFNASAVISVTDNTNAALRITQLGTGNALLVEDSSNPDPTPFLITAAGQVVKGYTSPITAGQSITPVIQTHETIANSGFGAFRWSADSGSANYRFAKSRGASIGTMDVVLSSDTLGVLSFDGADGSTFIPGASINAYVDGTATTTAGSFVVGRRYKILTVGTTDFTLIGAASNTIGVIFTATGAGTGTGTATSEPYTNSMPGRLVFSTTADGASTPTERMRIDSSGNVGIGSTSLTGRKVVVSGTATGAVTAYGIYDAVTFQSDVTTHAYGIRSQSGTQAASFTLPLLSHYAASQGTFGVGSTVTTQYGFNADASLTGATNNYGFYGNIASGSNRWNFYANGTADNYFAGNVGIAKTPAVALDVSGTMRSTSTTITGAAGGTITPTSDATNQYTITALGAAATIAIPSGTPIDGQKLTIRIKDNGTARALTWTTSAGGYRIIGTTLPVTTVISKTVYIGCVYNSADSFWDVVAVAQQA